MNESESRPASSEAPAETTPDTTSISSGHSHNQLQIELDAALAKVAELQDAYLRAKAEADNVRRRSQDEVAKAHKYGIEKFAESLVPVMDSLHAALTTQNATPETMKEGMEITLRQLVAAFEKGGVVELNPVGEKFDPRRHQAIASVPAEAEPNTVVAVMQRGYLIADRVLRPALVTVAAGQ
ncbi:MAG: nucleotide exchange factor GrpE [Burkholderiales bacterium]|jgi:molecular chaperone GrpE|nr:nucleotide exchange factor GrpE [Burkholderiales bacterium]MCA3163912.1 nucleotide exchange factor GrpE [Burkholderiales bacterium]MCA3165303.1 nucleotide exchange factor GrpE [Burkholderiales bacterium]MCA3170453.1 nucleotide exchange factor GrpE [Burkholderiales bacterium]MCA3171991.1 nucleotide exchange factor GrpE [Burkholderiales bacterium]